MPNPTYRILAEGELMSNDTWQTGINNNDLIIGPSGAGKTRGYVKPNILQGNESMIVADTKGTLCNELKQTLRRRGYKVVNIDFTDTLHSWGYNPLDYIRRDESGKKYCEQDIVTLCAALVPLENRKEPFWDYSARILLASIVGYVLECLPAEERTFESVVRLFGTLAASTGAEGDKPAGGAFHRLMEELGAKTPDSFAYRQYLFYKSLVNAKTTDSCVRAFVAEKLGPLSYDGPRRMFTRKQRLDFRQLGREKTAVFLNVSDTDRSMDQLVNVFYTQAFHALCASADRDYPDHRLPVPVRVILDDFATNAQIPDFDKLISVIRSREIYVSIILQSLSQLDAIYGKDRRMTIVNNCDNCLYLGGQDVETADYIAVKANKTSTTILNMPLNMAYLFTRGTPPKIVRKYDVTAHTAYPVLPETGARGAEAEAPGPEPK